MVMQWLSFDRFVVHKQTGRCAARLENDECRQFCDCN